MLGWLTDILRICWGFVYWNSRKSVYRWSGRRGVCPCQNSSDSGRAGETGCDAALNFAKPIRFRVVCPLLKPTADGTLMCSVNKEDVRPFWGRVVVTSILSVTLFYTAVVLTIFGFMRQVGYPISVQMVAWPPKWSEINQAKSQYFLQNAQEAFTAGELTETVMSLSLAYEYDVYNYEAGFFLARLWQANRPEFSNHLYQELISNHPEHRTQTAQAWLRSLLPRADYNWIEKLAINALRFGDNSSPAWLNAFLFSNQRTENDTVIPSLLATPETLSPGVETVLRWEQRIRQSPPEIAREFLLQPPPLNSPDFVYYFQIRLLISMGFPIDAVDIINEGKNPLSDRDRITLELEALAQANFQRSYHKLFDSILRISPSLGQIDILAVHLITNPNQEYYRRTKTLLTPSRLSSQDQKLTASLALFFLAGVHGDIEYQNQLAAEIRELTQSKFLILDATIAAMARPKIEQSRVRSLLPGLQPLSLDLTYALLEYFETEEIR